MNLSLENLGIEVDVMEVKGKTSSVRLKKGKAVVRLSQHLIGLDRKRALDKFLKWVKERAKDFSTGGFFASNYNNGGFVITHNKVYRILISQNELKRSSFKINDDCIDLHFGDGGYEESRAEKIIKRLIMKDQLNYLHEVLDELNALYFQADFKEAVFKDVDSKYGSCNSKKKIIIAYKLLLAPREVFRYVCIHELAHLIEFNHSKRFWSLVEEAMPDYKESENWLKLNGWKL